MRILYSVLSFAVIVGLVYGLGAFVVWDVNPQKWDAAGRFIVGFVGLAFGALSALAVYFEAWE